MFKKPLINYIFIYCLPLSEDLDIRDMTQLRITLQLYSNVDYSLIAITPRSTLIRSANAG